MNDGIFSTSDAKYAKSGRVLKVAEHDGRGFMAAGGTEYYRMSVAGVASLNGRLDVTLDHMHDVPSPSDAFVVLSADSLTGAFANVANGPRLTTTDGTGSFLVHYGGLLEGSHKEAVDGW